MGLVVTMIIDIIFIVLDINTITILNIVQKRGEEERE